MSALQRLRVGDKIVNHAAFDGMIQLQAKIFKRFSVIAIESVFGWKDATIGTMRTRRETFTGLRYDLQLRKF